MSRKLFACAAMCVVAQLSAVTYGARAARPASAAARRAPSPHRALLDQYCVGCHNERAKSGGLALDTVDVDHVAADVAVWEKAVRKLRARAMPPAGRARPDDEAYTAFIDYLEASLDRVAAAAPNPGRTETFHRLNRSEYQNAVRDLLAVEIDAASLLPGDDASHGFDNVNVGGLSPTLLDSYVSAARKISRLALGSPVRGPTEHTVILPLDLTQNEQVHEQLPFGTRGGTIFRHTFPQDGEYLFQIRLTRDRDERIEGLGEGGDIELAVDGERLQVFTLLPPPKTDGQDPEYRVDNVNADAKLRGRYAIKAGPHRVTVSFLGKPSAVSEAARQPFLADYNGRRLAAIFSVSVAGPFNPTGAGDTASRRRIFSCRPTGPVDEPGCATRIVSALARRAYRRPVASDEVKRLLTFYQQSRAEGSDFEAGMEMALRALLVSPQFLFRIERDPPNVPAGTAYALGDLELASRLSFFIWSSIPDDQLIDVAAAGKLQEPAVLEQQVRRMLKDPRSAALVTNFAGQWLYLRNLAAATPDPRLFPDFDDNLRQAFRRETELFFESIKTDDRSVLDLLTANYTFLNERLARHYGIPHVYGAHFRRVMLPEGSPRGGLLGQASLLTVTSYANRTSPVQRGKWVLENLIGMAPPAPPANVPPLPETGGKALTMRERMTEHRANPACSSCHALMDPIGLATENFDAVGQWRTHDGRIPIDATGALPDGRPFDGVSGLRQALAGRPREFAANLTEKLLTYALGRGLEPTDAAAVRAITRNAAATNYRFSSIMAGVATSTPFRMRRTP